jgi:ABC-2 type transport system permease protein
MILALSRIELTLLLRNRTAAAMAVAMPLLLGGFFALSKVGDWPVVIALQIVFTLAFTGYLACTTALVGRRQDLYLKRLRTGQASDATVLTGLLLPSALLGCAQAVLLLGVSVASGAPLPDRPLLALVAVLGGFAMACAVGVFTSAVTSTVELAQITTFPFFGALLVGVNWGLQPDTAEWVNVIPGAAVATLVRAAWGAPTDQVLPALAALAAWTAAGAFLSARYFRWEPRA